MLKFIINLIITAACTYFITFFSGEKKYGLLLIPIGVLALQGIVNFALARKESKAVTVILRFLYDRGQFPRDANVRVTLLKPNKLTKNFRQVARYSLSQPTLTNHKFHIDKGVAGKARREKEPQCFEVDANFHKAIMRDLGFTDAEARKFIQKAEYFCIPIFDKNKHVTYVLSFDSDTPSTFTESVISALMKDMPFVASILNKVYEDEGASAIADFYS